MLGSLCALRKKINVYSQLIIQKKARNNHIMGRANRSRLHSGTYSIAKSVIPECSGGIRNTAGFALEDIVESVTRRIALFCNNTSKLRINLNVMKMACRSIVRDPDMYHELSEAGEAAVADYTKAAEFCRPTRVNKKGKNIRVAVRLSGGAEKSVAGLHLSVARIKAALKRHKIHSIDRPASIYATAFIEKLVASIVHACVNDCDKNLRLSRSAIVKVARWGDLLQGIVPREALLGV